MPHEDTEEAPPGQGEYQAIAAFSDAVISDALGRMLAATNRPAAVLSGAVMACCRLVIQHMIPPPQVITIRAVNTFMLRAANQAAEALIRPPGKPN